MWHILLSHKMLMSLLAFCFQQEILCLFNWSNQQGNLPPKDLWREPPDSLLFTVMIWLTDPLPSTGHKRNTAAYIWSLAGFTAEVRHLLQTWDRRMLSLSKEPTCLYAMLASVSRGIHRTEMLFSLLLGIKQVADLILFSALWCHDWL